MNDLTLSDQNNVNSLTFVPFLMSSSMIAIDAGGGGGGVGPGGGVPNESEEMTSS